MRRTLESPVTVSASTIPPIDQDVSVSSKSDIVYVIAIRRSGWTTHPDAETRVHSDLCADPMGFRGDTIHLEISDER